MESEIDPQPEKRKEEQKNETNGTEVDIGEISPVTMSSSISSLSSKTFSSSIQNVSSLSSRDKDEMEKKYESQAHNKEKDIKEPKKVSHDYFKKIPGKEVLLDLCDIGPFEKWSRYRIFPIKYMLNIFLTILTTIVILQESCTWNPYILSNKQSLCVYFSPECCIESTCSNLASEFAINIDETPCALYSRNNTINSMNKVVNGYFTISNTSITSYSPYTIDGKVQPMKVVFEYDEYKLNKPPSENFTSIFYISEENVTDFFKSFTSYKMSTLQKITYQFYVMDTYPNDRLSSSTHINIRVCYIWQVIVEYSMHEGSEVKVKVSSKAISFCLTPEQAIDTEKASTKYHNITLYRPPNHPTSFMTTNTNNNCNKSNNNNTPLNDNGKSSSNSIVDPTVNYPSLSNISYLFKINMLSFLLNTLVIICAFMLLYFIVKEGLETRTLLSFIKKLVDEQQTKEETFMFSSIPSPIEFTVFQDDDDNDTITKNASNYSNAKFESSSNLVSSSEFPNGFSIDDTIDVTETERETETETETHTEIKARGSTIAPITSLATTMNSSSSFHQNYDTKKLTNSSTSTEKKYDSLNPHDNVNINANRISTKKPLRPLQWSEVSWNVKCKFWNYWSVITMIAAIFSITSSSYLLLTYYGPIRAHKSILVCRGIGCTLFYFNLVGYLKYSEKFYTIILVIQRSIPMVFNLLLSILPLFFSFTLVGMIIFGNKVAYFGNVGDTITTLFSMLNNDMLQQIIRHIFSQFNGNNISDIAIYYFALAYAVGFAFIFVYVILNIILSRVQESTYHVNQNVQHGITRRRINCLLRGPNPYYYKNKKDSNNNDNNNSDKKSNKSKRVENENERSNVEIFRKGSFESTISPLKSKYKEDFFPSENLASVTINSSNNTKKKDPYINLDDEEENGNADENDFSIDDHRDVEEDDRIQQLRDQYEFIQLLEICQVTDLLLHESDMFF